MSKVDTAILTFAAVILLWELIWKGVALWKAARNNQMGWYLFMLIFVVSVGIFPIGYLLFFQKKSKPEQIR